MVRRLSIVLLAGLTMVSLAAASAGAQQAPADPAPTGAPAALEQEIIVEAAPLLEALPGFVNKALPAAHGKQLARWHGPICTAARGFFPQQEKAILARMNAVAGEAGLPAAKPDCQPNVVLLLTDQPDLLIDTLLEKYGALFAPQPLLDVRRALARTNGDPVRVWYDKAAQSAKGQELEMESNGQGGMSLQVRADPGNATRIGSPIRLSLRRTVIILDVRRVQGLTLNAVADHVAMLALGPFETDFDGNGLDTVLNLFRAGEGARPAGLTDWDRALLRALYATKADISAAQQRHAITRRMATGKDEP